MTDSATIICPIHSPHSDAHPGERRECTCMAWVHDGGVTAEYACFARTGGKPEWLPVQVRDSFLNPGPLPLNQ